MAIHSPRSMRVLFGKINIHSPLGLPRSLLRRKSSAASKTPNELKTDKALPPTNPAKSPLLQRLGPLSIAVNAYDRVQKNRPWATQLCASIVVYLCGDQLAQYIDGERYDPLRTIRHLTIGAGAAIPGYTWQRCPSLGLTNPNQQESAKLTNCCPRFMYLARPFNYPSFLLSLATSLDMITRNFCPFRF